MLEAISELLVARGLINSQWYSDTYKQGQLVHLYREYYDGYHRMLLTTEMQNMLNIRDSRLQRYNVNYCELIIASMADRLTVERIDAAVPKPDDMDKPVTGQNGMDMQTPATGSMGPIDPQTGYPKRRAVVDSADSYYKNLSASDKKVVNPTQAWVEDLLDDNRFDALQISVREAVLRDGETFILSEYDDDDQCIKFSHEPAWDSEIGTVVIYERGSTTEIACAVKVWYDVPKVEADVETNVRKDGTYMRANIYFPDHTEKYHSSDGTDVMPMLVGGVENSHIESTVRANQVPGVPIVRFHNKNGVSELVNIIPLQDSLNSFLVDLVMAAQLTAFSIFFAVGVDVPQGITPGMVIRKNLTNADGTQYYPDDLEGSQIQAAILGASRLQRIEGGDLTQIMGAIDMVINQIAVISSTPVPNQMGGKSASGEALKQRDVRLLGKLARAQVQFGNSWEDAILLANTQTTLFSGKNAPPIDKLNTRWKSAEIRNDTDILAAADLLQKWGFEREALRTLSQSTLASFTEGDIDRMMKEKNADSASKLKQAMGSLNDFSSLTAPVSTPKQAQLNGKNATPATANTVASPA